MRKVLIFLLLTLFISCTPKSINHKESYKRVGEFSVKTGGLAITGTIINIKDSLNEIITLYSPFGQKIVRLISADDSVTIISQGQDPQKYSTDNIIEIDGFRSLKLKYSEFLAILVGKLPAIQNGNESSIFNQRDSLSVKKKRGVVRSINYHNRGANLKMSGNKDTLFRLIELKVKGKNYFLIDYRL